MIKAAAIKRSDGVVVTGKQHSDCIQKSPFGTCKSMSEQGFITTEGEFVNRVEAGKIAWEAGQLKKDPRGRSIISEEIWEWGNCDYDDKRGYYFKE